MSKGRKGAKSKTVLAVILCIPLAFIVYFAVVFSSKTVSPDNVNRVTVRAPGASETVMTGKEDIDFFVDGIINSAKSISTPMRDVSSEEPVYIIYDRIDKTITYRLYPTLNLSGCLLVSPDNDLFVLDTDVSSKLLLRGEFDYLYSQSFLPTLYITSGDNVVAVDPVESDWKYIKSDGNEYTYTPERYADGDETYTVYKGNDNKLVFYPDYDAHRYEMSDISYTAENGTQYMIRDISELDLSFDTVIDVGFTVKWSSLNGAGSYGEAKYAFRLLYDIPADLSISRTDYTVGDVIVIEATHLNPREQFELVADFDTAGIRFNMTGEDKGVALIPVGLSVEEGEHVLKIRSGAGETEFTLNVKALDDSRWTPVPVTTEDYFAKLSPEKLAAAKSVLDSVTRERPLDEYIVFGSDKLREPVSKSEVIYNFGERVNIANADITGDAGNQIISGKVYALSDGTQVRSAQQGVVVLSEELGPTGNTVVIYHGCGIFSYYFHLDKVNVEVGYTLTSGEIIGTAGQTGYTGGKTMLHFALSVDGSFIDPAALIK